MEYPMELINEASQRMKGYQVEGFVAGQGPLHPKLMLIGEAPGKTEIENHIPFSGQAGKELMNALALAGLSREDVYITSAVRSRPYRVVQRINKRTKQQEIVYPNRTPTKGEVFAHAPILDYELQHVQPTWIAALGNIGLQRLLGTNYTVSKNHGQLYKGPVLELNQQKDAYQYSEKHYRVLPLFHPAAIFYNRSLAPIIQSDWQILTDLLTNER
ncbi:uracil-DNA glycosylase [Enterococcus sp. 10A9_DIV0425]|uniref:Uracil-DNA glycosylase n=1 Tax=Candidatus Enterococcus wittei TaxID=1987383 RepID=A0A242JWB1_9ENTE|nr:uracil-DNA glycosylase [Enterococcus sp. 10A9_DIV0425]OTP09605.1 uracil-DNA glycosylase [Enterococcus sp. 10A9_DIV0425]THE06886.1 uracil-DNA glycosylase [Enterococcus hirae]